MWATLGVYPLAYLPYAFMNLLTPIISIVYGFTGITMEKTSEATAGAEAEGEAVGPARNAR
jgi:NhaC family Na+:H+ antiporter